MENKERIYLSKIQVRGRVGAAWNDMHGKQLFMKES